MFIYFWMLVKYILKKEKRNAGKIYMFIYFWMLVKYILKKEKRNASKIYMFIYIVKGKMECW